MTKSNCPGSQAQGHKEEWQQCLQKLVSLQDLRSSIHEVKEQAPASPVLMKRSLRRILGYRWLDSISSGPPCVHVTSLSPPEYQSQVCAKHTPFGELLCPLRPPPIYGLHGGSSGTRMGALDQESSKVKYIPVPCFFFYIPPASSYSQPPMTLIQILNLKGH